MTEFEVTGFGNTAPYPMYFTLKGKDGKSFTKAALTHDGKPIVDKGKPLMDNFVNGVSIITVVHTAPIAVGDSIEISKTKHIVEEILEERKPGLKTTENPNNANHHPEEATFYRLTASYTRFTGQTV